MKSNESTRPVIAVIGGGASGVTAAVCAAKEAARIHKKADIIIFEAADRLLKKILVTGNGRCNLSNADISESDYFGARSLFRTVYSVFDREDTLSFFNSLGLLTVTDEAGRIYPRSMKAASVVDVMLHAVSVEDIKVQLNTKIVSLQKTDKGYLLNGRYAADCVIIASGGMTGASGKLSDSVYETLRKNGVTVTPLRPALTAFTIKDFTKGLKGIRALGEITLCSGKSAVAHSAGEIQYTEYGISGIPAMQLSSYAAREASGKPLTIVADILPEITDDAFRNHFLHMQNADPLMTALLLLCGFVPKPLGIHIIKQAGGLPDMPLRDADAGFLSRLIDCCKRMPYSVKGVRGFEYAQVTSGGISPQEIDDRLMLKKLPGVFVCGEITDVDGNCGGYNLQWAWSSGAVAGKNSILEIG